MAEISERSVAKAIESYEEGSVNKDEIFEWAKQLQLLQEEVSELAVELFARYQPVATDLRFIKSSMEIAYGFARFGGYAHDIVDIISTMGSVSHCDKRAVLEVSQIAIKMTRMSVLALQTADKDAADKLYEMDETVEALYRKFLREAITPHGKRGSNKLYADPRCYVSGLLILRYLERISDHACSIASAVKYIATGTPARRL
jgi:phosphate transport system protein